MLVAAISLATGALIGRTYQTNTLILASIAIASIWITASIIRWSFSLADVLLFLSYLSALQGGFLIGAYLQTRYEESKVD